MTTAYSLLRQCRSWPDFQRIVEPLPAKLKGDCFELLTQAFLRLDSRYRCKLTEVWSTHGEVPRRVLVKLNLFGSDVTGIDLVAETEDGKYWAVQCKYHQDHKQTLTREEAKDLIAGRNRARAEFELGLIATTVDARSRNLAGEPDLEYLMGDVWRGLGAEFFQRFRAQLRGLEPKRPRRKKPRRHQGRALAGIVRHFSTQRRGKVVMPCATGKSLIGFWAAEQLGARRVLVAVPNLSLVRQLLKDWTEQSLANGRRPRWAVVCSDESVAEPEAVRDLGVKVDTDPRAIARWLRPTQSADVSVVFTTYQSGPVLAEAARQAHVQFDLGIFDEAHRTAGQEDKRFSLLLRDDIVRIRKRIFMTATPRVFRGNNREDIISMDDPDTYGGDAFKMTFLQAMRRHIIPNLTIVAVNVARPEVQRLLRDRRFVRLQHEHKEDLFQYVVSELALRKAMKKYRIHHTLGFYTNKKRCLRAREIQQRLGELLPEYGALDLFHVDGEMTAAARDSELRVFEQSEHALLTNVRVFGEGVDCPSMDCVLFADPRQSRIDIVQAIGRALRPFENKKAGYALIPVVIERDGTPSDRAFKEIVRVTTALGSEDEVVVDFFVALANGRPWAGPHVFEWLGVPVGVKLDLEKVNQAVAVGIYERTVEFLPFKKARAYARKLGFDGEPQWREWSKSGTRPLNIPATPATVYKNEFRGFADWLGYRPTRQRGNKLPFAKARAYVHKLGLGSMKAWQAWSKSRKRPLDMPSDPSRVYRGEFKSWSDWLGFKPTRGTQFLPFSQARALARRLGFGSETDWRKWCNSGKRPLTIPALPQRVYKREFEGWPDWLGYRPKHTTHFRPFRVARANVRKLGLRSLIEWQAWSAGGKRPLDVPGDPRTVYRHEFKGWPDWLGYRRTRGRGFLPFPKARAFVRKLGLKSQREWIAWARTRTRPLTIPADPYDIYRGEFKGLADWLGYQPKSAQGIKLPFEKARAYARSLGLSSTAAWRAWSKSGKRPLNIPSVPYAAYRAQFKGWPDWLGYKPTREVGNKLPFARARAYVRKLGLRSTAEWREWSKRGKRPLNIPSAPNMTYRAQFKGWPDWLGYDVSDRRSTKRL